MKAFCDPYIWENPKVIMSTGLTWKARKEGPCASEVVNVVMLVYIIAFFLGSVLTVTVGTNVPLPILLGLATVYSLPSFWALIKLRSTCDEGFESGKIDIIEESKPATPAAATLEPAYSYEVIGSGFGAPASATLPTARNPFMNVLIDEIKYKPKRAEAVSINDPSIKVTLDDFFRTEFNRDPTDVFGKTQSQRQFVTMPSTTIPNDQDSYQKWLYGIAGKTCKEGGREACLPGTDGGALPWLNANT